MRAAPGHAEKFKAIVERVNGAVGYVASFNLGISISLMNVFHLVYRGVGIIDPAYDRVIVTLSVPLLTGHKAGGRIISELGLHPPYKYPLPVSALCSVVPIEDIVELRILGALPIWSPKATF